jgi:hypothetical protein
MLKAREISSLFYFKETIKKCQFNSKQVKKVKLINEPVILRLNNTSINKINQILKRFI